ncbi:DUF4432 family protein [Candidatus Bathyarchaeota archaeon]|nr:MAG: DUF4432 family protein [Candidatus Bathyarchaeota archaeon]
MFIEDSRMNEETSFFEKTLLDEDNGVYVEKWSLSSQELRVGRGWRIEKRRLYGGLSDGVDLITLDNGELSFTIVPTRGMSIWKGMYKSMFLGWNSPIKNPVHPRHINLEAMGGTGLLEGFNEMIVRCGLSSLGAPATDVIMDNMGRKKEIMLTLHGKIANIPASLVNVRVGLKPPFPLEVEGVVYERSMFGPNLKLSSIIRTIPGSNLFTICDVIENLSGSSSDMQILYHCNYGSPILEEGSRFIAPIEKVVPRDSVAAKEVENFDVYGPPRSGFIEHVYFMKMLSDDDGNTTVLLTNKDMDKAVSISYSVNELPCFTLWKNTSSLEDGYVTGLEPGTSFPNVKPFERKHGRVISLNPGEKFISRVTVSAHLGKDNVRKMLSRVEAIRRGRHPEIFRAPLKEFSPS